MITFQDFDELRNLTIGTIDYVSPNEIKVLLEIHAPQNTSINTGTLTPFPKINGYMLIPNENGAIVGLISWIAVEHSQFPKRKGFKDFDLIDLPYPQRKMSLNPLGILKRNNKKYKFERGIYSYPSIGDPVVLPTHDQLQAIIENRDEDAHVSIGYAPIAANAQVKVNPDKLFGRHLAVLGNTGSGKSCSVAGMIRWSLESARSAAKGGEIENDAKNRDKLNLNARFIILDPNGEYSSAFDDLKTTVRKFKVTVDDTKTEEVAQLKVPAWMWNSFEWSSIMQATGKTQRPLLHQALREMRNAEEFDLIADINAEVELEIRRHFSSCLVSLKNDLINVKYKDFPHNKNFADKILTYSKEAEDFYRNYADIDGEILSELQNVWETLRDIVESRRDGNYFKSFIRRDVINAIAVIESLLKSLKLPLVYGGPSEDSPVPFNIEELPNHLELLGREQAVIQYLDFLIMRIRSMLSDSRMQSIIKPEIEISLTEWLEEYIGGNQGCNGEIAVIDLSIVPTDVVHLVVAVIARIIFEALQRYRRLNTNVLPTVLVLDEAHTFVKKIGNDKEELSSAMLCCQTFERIAREGRKFGLGLLLSSQRPSELSPTVLSQCNTFLLHRLVNDRDQELVKRLVPDNLGALLGELPVLPTKKAILLGWAAPIPTLIEMRELKENDRPKSSDPDFWGVWTGIKKRDVDWGQISKEWQER